MKKYFLDVYLYDFYLIPTIHVYSRRKDTYTIEFAWLKFYFGWEKSQ